MQCRVKFCRRNHSATALMCGRCWASLPPGLQHRFQRIVEEVNEAVDEDKRWGWRKDDVSTKAHVSIAINHARDFTGTVLEVAWFTRHGAWPGAELATRAGLTEADRPAEERVA